ncbi:mitogen-activated protein kinase kinase kinase 7-like [Drosophila innubila]|uniref:mitogen-activated protein kinase kinase kinase 7-like n=1 Tax=Drosophila innubila TaxID=198719 RepID=UPI00148B3642|nr:mitogen-activated protein kinase kinase kinase 7-like [Drosophila innubila]
MEYADCGSLHEQIHGTGVQNYTTSTALNWMYQCAMGLEFLHNQSIVHWNVKPRNLFLTKNFQQLKIGELGNTPRQLRKRESVVYKAPEGPFCCIYDEKYDVYSFGIVLWEVLTRQKPFYKMTFVRETSNYEQLFSHFPQDLSCDNIRSLIESCWNLDPKKRPTMKAVAVRIAVEKADMGLDEIMGSGAFGVVYKYQLIDVPCAVKKFFVDDDDAKKKIEREVKYLSRVTHENIVELFCTLHSKDSKTFIVMAYADCGTLYDYIHKEKEQKRNEYSDSTALSWMRQLAKGLHYLHATEPKPIIHRDIKTSNLLLADNYQVLKIADFGTVREQATVMTKDYVGTPEYMAPETGLGYEYSEKSDVYSFGIVFWEVMSRKKPFYHLKNRTPIVIMNLVSQGERPPIEDTKDDKYIRTIINYCWHKNPEIRPSSWNLAYCGVGFSIFHVLSEILNTESVIKSIIPGGTFDKINFKSE